MARPRSPETAALSKRVVELRRQRWSFAAIGDEVGCSAPHAHRTYYAALAAIPATEVTAARDEETQLIDDAVRDLMGIAFDGEVSPRTRVEAWSSVRGWSEHRARVLGLNAPTKVAVNHTAESDFDRAWADLTAAMEERARVEGDTADAP